MEGGFRNRPIHHSFRGFQDIQTCSCSRQNVYTSVFILLSLFKKGTYIFKRFYFQTLLIKNRRNVSQTQTLYLSGPKLLRPASPPTPSQVREESLRQTEHRRAQLCVHVMKHLKPSSFTSSDWRRAERLRHSGDKVLQRHVFMQQNQVEDALMDDV